MCNLELLLCSELQGLTESESLKQVLAVVFQKTRVRLSYVENQWFNLLVLREQIREEKRLQSKT